MKLLEVDLYREFPMLPPCTVQPRLTGWLREISEHLGYGPEKQRHPVMLVLPGGAWSHTSNREADPTAVQFFAANFHTFILHYSVAPDRSPLPQLQIAASILYIRQHADELHADPNHIYVCGFSAGGHLAAYAGACWKTPVLSETLGVPARLLRPDGMVLAYPAINSSEPKVRFGFVNLLGDNPTQEALDAVSPEKHVDADTAPAFLWHTFTDPVVPLEHTLEMAEALRKHDVPFELHIFPEGGHGLSTADGQAFVENYPEIKNPHVAQWMPLCIDWLRRIQCRDLENWM